MSTILVTGGSGFFGQILLTYLLEAGHRCVSVDLLRSVVQHPRVTSVVADVRDLALMKQVVRTHEVDAAVHCAALLAHVRTAAAQMDSVNVDGTRAVAEALAERPGAPFVFISTNCLWARGFDDPVDEYAVPKPIEPYGRSKRKAETMLQEEFASKLRVVIMRTPTIVDAGRVGLLAILFEFVREGRRLWCVGSGQNRYQFLYAWDLAVACGRAIECDVHGIFHVGSDAVDTLAGVYRSLVAHAGTKSRVTPVPRWLVLPALAVLNALRLSPLGPYQYRMISESFVFDTRRAKRELGWVPTLTNAEILCRAYDAYLRERGSLLRDDEGSTRSPHRRPVAFGVLRLVKWLS